MSVISSIANHKRTQIAFPERTHSRRQTIAAKAIIRITRTRPGGADARVRARPPGHCFSDSFIGRYGASGRDIIIGPSTHDFDFSMRKRFPLGREERDLQFRSEIFNLFNHPNFDNPNVTESSSTFGKITSAGVQDSRASSRQIQFALRLVF